MSEYLSALVPTANLWAWYPLNETATDGAFVTTVADASGNGRDLAAAGAAPDAPVWAANGLGSRKTIVFNQESPLQRVEAVNLKHIFIVAKSGAVATFDTFRGLIGDAGAADGILMGDSGTSKFFNWTYGAGFSYVKSQVLYAENNQQAPFTNFELMEIAKSAGFGYSGLRVGQDRNNVLRKWIGSVAEIITYTSVLSANDVYKLRLYFDLKFGLWRTSGTALFFPHPDVTGIQWERFYAEPLDWEDVTVSHEYDDRGRSFNDISDTPPQFWEIGFTGLTTEEADIFDAFNNQVRRSRTFSLVDKWGETHTGLRIMSYKRSHEKHKSWIHECRFKLVKYP